MPNKNFTKKQLTLVSFYGNKTDSLGLLINSCIQKIQQSPLGELFRPYDINQIHGTIIGMERYDEVNSFYNLNIATSSNNKTTMDFSNFYPTIHKKFPMTIQVGGFPPSFDEFTSAGEAPNIRSFQIQWKNRKVMLVGWPHVNGKFTQQLNNVRTDFLETCNIAHKYNNDNDLFMVLGEIDYPKHSSSETHQLKLDVEELEKTIRDYLYKHPINIILGLDSLSLAQYTNPTLPITHTINHTFNKPGMTAEYIKALYS